MPIGEIMQDWLLPYAPTLWSLGAMSALYLVQIVMVDITSIKAKHPPGTPVEANHDNYLFRVVRAHANTNEGIAGFILLVLFAVFSAASAAWLNSLAWAYVLARAGYTLCYYADVRTLRSVMFAIALLALVAMLVVGIVPWL